MNIYEKEYYDAKLSVDLWENYKINLYTVNNCESAYITLDLEDFIDMLDKLNLELKNIKNVISNKDWTELELTLIFMYLIPIQYIIVDMILERKYSTITNSITVDITYLIFSLFPLLNYLFLFLRSNTHRY